MEPLSKEEIDTAEYELFIVMGYPKLPTVYQRLFYTARLGAQFVKATEQKEQP